MKAITKTQYRCPACWQEYDNEDDANACFKIWEEQIANLAVGQSIECRWNRYVSYGMGEHGTETTILIGHIIRLEWKRQYTAVKFPRALVEWEDGERWWASIVWDPNKRGAFYWVTG